MKICTWNVNSVSSRLEILLTWLEKYKPDIVLLQETKCINEKFPRSEIEELGYNIAIHGQKTYNGVAILSFSPIDEFHTELPSNPRPEDARYIEAIISVKKGAIRVASVYVPNGHELGSEKYKMKLDFMDALYNHMESLKELDEICVIGGDFNVAPEDMDVYSPDTLKTTVLFDLAIRKKFRSLTNLDYIDAFRASNPTEEQFTWWDYRGGSWQKNKGARIDHLLLSPYASDLLTKSYVHSDLRNKDKPSDHIPVICELSI